MKHVHPPGARPASQRPSRDGVDLRAWVGAILAAEESDPPQWAQVVELSDELEQQLASMHGTRCPAIVSYYIDDADIRLVDEGFARRQRERVRQFIRTGRSSAGGTVRSCALVVAAEVVVEVVGLILG